MSTHYTGDRYHPEGADSWLDSAKGQEHIAMVRAEAKTKPADTPLRLDEAAQKVGECLAIACAGKEIQLKKCSHEGNRTLQLTFTVDRALYASGCEAAHMTMKRLLHEFRWMLEEAVSVARPTAEEVEAELRAGR